MTIAFTTGWLTPYYTGPGVAAAAGVASPVSLGGVAYELITMVPGTETRYEFSRQSIPHQRVAFEDKSNASRGTLNPEAFWRTVFESWHVGAGQATFDRIDESDPYRFRRSRGIDPWTRYQVSLLPDTDQKRSSANTNLFLAVAGDYLYLTDGTALLYTQDVTVDSPTWTTVTGGTAATYTSMASDGYHVVLADGARIQHTTRGAATKTDYITGACDLVFHGKGRWVAAHDADLYDITTEVASGGALPTAHFTHPNTDWDWTAFAEGPSALYAAGTAGDKSLIYRLTMKEDGTGLNQPVVAGFLPDGETVSSMQGYLGFVLIGTSKGVRIGVPGGNADLTIGALISTDVAVQCFEGQERFVWFGWTNHESTTSGLGRIDLQTFSDTEALAPAYASDLMATSGTGATQSVVTFQGIRVFTVSATGVWGEDTDLVSSGTIDSGIFDFGLTDEKLSLYVDSAHLGSTSGSHGGTHEFFLARDGGSFGSLGTATGHDPIATGEARGHNFELRLTLSRDGSDPTDGPTLTMWGLRVQPVPPRIHRMVIPLRLGPTDTRADGVVENYDPDEQEQNIVDLCESGEVTQLFLGNRGFSVIVEDYQTDIHNVWIGHDATLGFRGACMVQVKTVAG